MIWILFNLNYVDDSVNNALPSNDVLNLTTGITGSFSIMLCDIANFCWLYTSQTKFPEFRQFILKKEA